MSWARLKGSDARRAAILREAAARTDCEVVLALADVHETWSCSEPAWESPWHARGRYRRWEDDDLELEYDDAWWGAEDSSDPDGYSLDELVDWGITLDCWVDPSGEQAELIVTSVGDDEVCATTPSADLRPYASEYEGYMGNYGNTMDRWYRRGAVVVWPRRRAFAVRAEASPRWALDQLTTRFRAEDVAGAQEMAATLKPFWHTVAGLEQRRGLLTKALRVARGLDEPALAAMLLQPFRVEMLVRGDAPALVALVEGYGEGWRARSSPAGRLARAHGLLRTVEAARHGSRRCPPCAKRWTGRAALVGQPPGWSWRTRGVGCARRSSSGAVSCRRVAGTRRSPNWPGRSSLCSRARPRSPPPTFVTRCSSFSTR